MPSINKDTLGLNIKFTAIFKGMLLALALSIIFSVLSGLIYHLTSIPEHTLPWAAALILGASACGGAASAGRNAGNKGLYHGILVGLLFFLAVWLAAGLFMPGQAVLSNLQKFIITLVAGSLGGIIGVGLS